MKIIQTCLGIALSAVMLSNSAFAERTNLYGFVKGFGAPNAEYALDMGYTSQEFIQIKLLSGSEAKIGTCAKRDGYLQLTMGPIGTGTRDSRYATAMHAYSNNFLVRVTIDETHTLGKSGELCNLIHIFVKDWDTQL